MAQVLPFIPALPLAAFFLLALVPVHFPRPLVVGLALGAAFGSAALFVPLLIGCASDACLPGSLTLATTMAVDGLRAEIALGADHLSVLCGISVAFVAAMVLFYSAGFMTVSRVPDQRRFFALMCLFLTGMLTVVLSANLLLLFLGWELIGLTSFFLIGYHTEQREAFQAGRKAFVMTRIGDTAFLAALILLVFEFGTLDMPEMTAAIAQHAGDSLFIPAILLLIGALGKSAQFPFQTWLPTAMAGPIPVSALLHSATMVAAGGFLLARFAPLYATNADAAMVVAVFGLISALFGAMAAMTQRDIKRALAYSSVSQIGYMVLAVGAGAPAAAMVHFVIHALFKSLLFLSAGVMVDAAGHSQDITDLQGSRARAPVAFWSFTAGAASLAGLPFVSAGWFSKEAILAAALHAPAAGPLIWAAALVAAVLTAAYAARLVFALGAPTTAQGETAAGGLTIVTPLVVLGILSLAGGFAVGPMNSFLGGDHGQVGWMIATTGTIAALAGIAIGRAHAATDSWLQTPLAAWLRDGFRADALYRVTFVRGFEGSVRALASDPVAGAFMRTICFLVLPERVASKAGMPPRGLFGMLRRALLRLRNAVQGDAIASRATEAIEDRVQAVIAAATPDYLDWVLMRIGSTVMALSGLAKRSQNGLIRTYAAVMFAGLILLLFWAWLPGVLEWN